MDNDIGNLNIHIDQLTKERDELKVKYEDAFLSNIEVTQLLSKASIRENDLAAKLDPMWRELVSHREKAKGNYWAWVKDQDENHLESLSFACPVLIHGIDLQAILKERDDALALLGAYKMDRDELAAKLDEVENQVDEDWLSAIQEINWGSEISLAEGNEVASEGRAEVINSIKHAFLILHNKLERAEAAGAEMRSILEHAVWHEWSEYNGASHYQLNNVDRCSVTHALSTQCGASWLSPEKAGRLRELIKNLRALVPIRPRAISYDDGWVILDHVQDVFLPQAEQALAETEDAK